ncbi:MAG: LacI family DNA-binding transcriptional regulator [Verrucomicrobiota bacterium]|nr:LacI family DNA-binding transcriptional regulator [Verrucomicrobiota bacterium]
MNTPTKKITLSDIAKAAGVSTCTASKILRDQAGYTEATRTQVKSVAARLGYQLNEVASLLAKHRTVGKSEANKLVVGFLDASQHSFAILQRVCEGMGLEARYYNPSDFSSPELAARVLYHQGVHGIIISPHRFPWSEKWQQEFDWSRFSVVKISRGLPALPVHLVRHSPFDYMRKTLDVVIDRGYKKIAVLMERSASQQDNEARLGAVLVYQHNKLPAGVTLRWLVTEADNPNVLDERTIHWIKNDPTDALITYHWACIYPLLQAGVFIPNRLAMAAVLADSEKIPDTPLVSGCDTNRSELYQRALRILQELILHGVKGLPLNPTESVIEPAWVEGETLPWRK